jgi:hypothetical protein
MADMTCTARATYDASTRAATCPGLLLRRCATSSIAERRDRRRRPSNTRRPRLASCRSPCPRVRSCAGGRRSVLARARTLPRRAASNMYSTYYSYFQRARCAEADRRARKWDSARRAPHGLLWSPPPFCVFEILVAPSCCCMDAPAWGPHAHALGLGALLGSCRCVQMHCACAAFSFEFGVLLRLQKIPSLPLKYITTIYVL